MKRACKKPWKFVKRNVVRAVRGVTPNPSRSSANPEVSPDPLLELYKDGVALDLLPKQPPEPYYVLLDTKTDSDSKSKSEKELTDVKKPSAKKVKKIISPVKKTTPPEKVFTDVSDGIDIHLYAVAQLEMIRKNAVDAYEYDRTYYSNTELIMSQFNMAGKPWLCGYGASGAVYKAYSKGKPNEEAVFKVVSCKYKTARYHQFWKEYAVREPHFLNQLDHQNVIKMYQFMWLDSSVLTQGCLAMHLECMDMDLEDFSKKVGPILVDKLIARVAAQALSGLEHIHSKQIVHNDICPENMLLAPLLYEWGKNGRHNMQKLLTATLKIGDFGESQIYPNQDALQIKPGGETTHYFSPEKKVFQTPYDPFKDDLYAVGVTLLELFTGKYWTEYSDCDDASQVAKKWLDADTHPVHAAIVAMLEPEATRPAVKEVLEVMQAQL